MGSNLTSDMMGIRDRPEPRVSSTQAQWVGEANERDSSTKEMRY